MGDERRLRVLSLSSVYPRRGEEFHGLFVRARLQALGERAAVRVAVPVGWVEYGNARRKFPGAVPGRMKDGSVEVFFPRWAYVPGRSQWNPGLMAWQVGRALTRVVEQWRPDVIDAHFGHPEGVAAMTLARKWGVPFTVTLRGSEVRHALEAEKREDLRKMFTAAARVMAVSGNLRDFAVSMGAAEGKSVTVPNGIDAGVFRPRDKAAVRARLGMREGAKHLLSVGHLIELKGHHRVVRALAEMREKFADAELWIAGGPGRDRPFDAEIRQAIAETGMGQWVHLLGAVPAAELAEWYSAADLLVLASAREGWPNVVHEALACGTPVLSTKVGGVPELIPDERYGMVVEEITGKALTGALGREWVREEIAEWGGRRSWGRVAEEVEGQLRLAVEGFQG